jgi:Domain of unknown function (DUF4389)
MPSYPIEVAADDELEGRNRVTTLLRGLVVIPWAIVATAYLLAAAACAVIAWFAIVLSGRYPRRLYGFNAKAVRMMARANGVYLLLTDANPPFNGDPDDRYPVRVAFAPPLPRYSRPRAALRPIVAIPVILLAYVQSIIGWACATVAWFAILFTDRVPANVFGAIRGAVAFQARAAAYLLLMTEDYPPFAYDAGVEPAALAGAPPPVAPGGTVAVGQARPPAPPPPPSPPPPQ